MQVPLMRLQCGANSYDWGKTGMSSAAARFASATDFKVEETKPYAELWMGTHPSLPSKDLNTGRTLIDIFSDTPGLLSTSVASKYGTKLPFLFKVLSISKALSIQAHPNKRLAAQLHARDPKNYPDDNHKPEMAIAITPFEGICGFRPLKEIAFFLRNVASLRQLVGEQEAKSFTDAVDGKEDAQGEEIVASNKQALQAAFAALMKNASDQSALQTAAADLIRDARERGVDFAGGGTGPSSGAELSNLVLRLDGQFPGDVGLFVLFFLNYVKLDVGEAMFLMADDIHAYVSGDIIECMASSDNVVRAGFTPKFKDVDTLTGMLTYRYAPIEEQKMEPRDYEYVRLDAPAYSAGSSCLLYDPPIEEFSVVRSELRAGKASFDAVEGPSIVLCTGGEGKISVGPTSREIKAGWVYFVGATAELVLEKSSGGGGTDDEPFVTFRAFCELDGGGGGGGGSHTNGKM